MITFVTGVSCSGKSSAYEAMGRLFRSLQPTVDYELPRLVEIDEGGTPDAGHLPWLEYRGQQLLCEALARADKDRHTIVFGISWPFKILDSTVWEEFPRHEGHIGFVLLDANDAVLRQRLRTRLADRDYTERAEYVRYNLRLAASLRRQVRPLCQSQILRTDMHWMTPDRVASSISWEWECGCR